SLVQHPAERLSGKGVWPIKLEVLVQRPGVAPRRVPVELSSDSAVIYSLSNLVSPQFIFANAEDNAYGLVLLDARRAEWLLASIGSVDDTFMRAMLWGALWDLVREARLAPGRFIDAAARELPREKDEQIAAGIIGRLSRATSSYLTDSQRRDVLPRVEQ